MVRIIGRLTKIGLGKETTKGTPVAPAFWVPVLDLGFDDRNTYVDNESGFGNLADSNDSRIVRQWAEGDYSGKIFDQSVGVELGALFGQSPTSTQRTTTGVYDHVFDMLQSNQHRANTLAIAEPNYTGRYASAMINTWALTAEMGDYIRRTVNLISKTSVSASDTPTYTNENEFLPKDMSVKFAAAGSNDATLDGATAAKVTSFNFNINKNADGLQVFGSNDLDEVVNKAVEVTGSFEAFYDDRTYQTLGKNGTHQAIRVEMLDSSTIIGTSGTHNPALRFTFREASMQYPEKDFDNNEIQKITVNFKAHLNLATGKQVEARLTNANAGTVY